MGKANYYYNYNYIFKNINHLYNHLIPKSYLYITLCLKCYVYYILLFICIEIFKTPCILTTYNLLKA